ncbi:MAG: FHA domain-containing protein [Desulforudis sp.]|jgi:hypothetical protein|nr:MAG: FHA domain-containing protein [Desulforudis sp.]
MEQYKVKICPLCGYKNSEFARLCKNKNIDCRNPLNRVNPQPDPDVSAEEHPVDSPEESPREENESQFASGSDEASLVLELPGMTLEIQPNDVLGRTFPGSIATKQVDGMPGINFMHRRHCSFACVAGQWQVIAIPGERFTNPTQVNGVSVPPGTARGLRDGDRLQLSGVNFSVRIFP